MVASPGRETGEYIAFISYCHADRPFAFWLHRRLETFTLPRALRASGGRRVFIDRAELSAGTDLSQEVERALANSAALVVVASPDARASRWVDHEIRTFLALHPDRPILTALYTGEPQASFPEALCQSGEPLAADFRREGDGRRLALLKLVGGLEGIAVDRLIQRDAQRRLHRVMAITAVALAISLAMGALAVTAMRARSEAVVQRNESEAVVEFMLTDLRQKLKGVGRLDVMDVVDARAMSHYNAMRNLAEMPDDLLERRARLLSAMGEDRLREGDYPRASAIFGQSWRVTADLLHRHPQDPQRVFDHAQNEYWLGEAAYLAADRHGALAHWTAYHDLSARLAVIEPGALRELRENGYAEIDLCALALSPPGDTAAALRHCAKAVSATQAIAEKLPQNLQAQIDLANDLGWQADAFVASGDKSGALRIRQRQSAVVDGLPPRFPRDVRVAQARMQAAIGLTKAARAAGAMDIARDALRKGHALAEQLRKQDPRNQQWAAWRGQINALDKDSQSF